MGSIVVEKKPPNMGRQTLKYFWLVFSYMPFFNEGKLQTHINSFACALECVKTSANKRPHPLVQETNSDAASKDLEMSMKFSTVVMSCAYLNLEASI